MRFGRTLAAVLGCLLSVAAWVPPVAVGAPRPDRGGRLEFVKNIPVDAGTSVGGRLVGDYFYLTSWRHISIYDVTTPTDPQLMSTVPIGTGVSNEDVATDGRLLLYSHQGWQPDGADNALYVWDVSNKKVPVLSAVLPGAGEHTMSCILRCKWAYGSDGKIIDLRDPTNPKIAGRWHNAGRFTNHDVEEVKPGFVVTTPGDGPMQLLDVRRPLQPRRVAEGIYTPSESWLHQASWPHSAADPFLLMGSEGPFSGLSVYDASGWRRTGKIRQTGSYIGLGDSAHWFTVHPDFDRGGLIAMAFHSEGTRVLRVDGHGRVAEMDVFALDRSDVWGSYWIDDEIIYNVDWMRGIDVLRWIPGQEI